MYPPLHMKGVFGKMDRYAEITSELGLRYGLERGRMEELSYYLLNVSCYSMELDEDALRVLGEEWVKDNV